MTSAPPLKRHLILAAVLAASFTIAVEATIVSTAMPKIVGQLGDLNLYSWVFTSFLLAQSATTVLFGKLADTYGRKNILLIGIAIFVVGSLLCGFSWSMPSLIVFRLIQGVGAGAIQPVSITLVGDLYSARERGKAQAYISAMWAISSILGPLAGGLIVENVSWAWVFWINVPLALAAAAGFFLFLREDIHHRPRSVDAIGALLFAILVSSVMYALTVMGEAEPGDLLLPLALAAASAVLFVRQELRTPEPMMNFRLWGRRVVAVASFLSLLSGVILTGLTTFLPMYVQAVMGQSALIAGFTLTSMVLGWPIASTTAARNFARFGLRGILVTGAMVLPLSAIPLIVMHSGMSPLVPALASLIMGFGLGFVSTSVTVIVQSSVGWGERGAATSAYIFSRNLGMTLGAATLGALLNHSLATGSTPITSSQIRDLLEHGANHPVNGAVQAAMGDGLHVIFWGIMIATVVTLLTALMIPSVKLEAKPAPAAG